MRLRVVLLSLLFAASCHHDGVDSLPPAREASDSPTNLEVLAYLAGRTLPPQQIGNKSLVIRLDGIEALSVTRSSSRIGDDTWSTAISFVYNTTRARYTVEARVEHRVVEGQRVFHALRLRRVARR